MDVHSSRVREKLDLLKDRRSAIREFEQELQLDPQNASAAYELGEVHRDGGDSENAERFFEQALETFPDFEEAHIGLAAVLMDLGKPDSALTHLQRAISLNPENEVSWFRLSKAERAVGNVAEAQKAIAKFKELHQRKEPQEGSGKPLFSSDDEVTKQVVDPTSVQ